MQLGTRWAVATPPPSSLPEMVRIAVESVEDDLRLLDVDATNWRWTLTWLEGKPVVELDDGTVIRYNPADDSAIITSPSDSEPDEFDQS